MASKTTVRSVRSAMVDLQIMRCTQFCETVSELQHYAPPAPKVARLRNFKVNTVVYE
jgi:hypothetical protein